ncbi:MAG: hypothetical protein HYS87_01920 [Candidatus Colwellbacteria bacterium]|nr:hypothetical protein [Candidatus Colwellbacteria bacterium]
MRKTYIFIFAGGIFLALAFLFFIVGKSTEGQGAHLYRNSDANISKINLTVFYTVPKDKMPYDFETVMASLEPALEEASAFHSLQFVDKSWIQYSIYPTVLKLERDSFFYDTEDTSRGNPNALASITEEIKDNNLIVEKKGEFTVLGIIYEGLGAAGALSEDSKLGSFILSRDFITREEYVLSRSALLYHEFGHTLGIPDLYDLDTGEAFTSDIMGGGRQEPLEANYIEISTLKEMGVL